MSSASRQTYLNTRVSVMTARLFEPGAVNDLVKLDIQELTEGFGLEAVLDDQLTTRAKSRAIEQSLIQVLLFELAVLIRPMNAAERAIVLAWARKYALYNLKTLIRGKLYNLEQREIRSNLYDLPENIRLPHQELFRAENVLELLRQLEDGPHRLIARQAREIYEQVGSGQSGILRADTGVHARAASPDHDRLQDSRRRTKTDGRLCESRGQANPAAQSLRCGPEPGLSDPPRDRPVRVVLSRAGQIITTPAGARRHRRRAVRAHLSVASGGRSLT